MTPKSSELKKLLKSPEKNRMLKLIQKITSLKIEIILNIVENNNDKTIIEKLSKLVKKESLYTEDNNIKKATYRWEKFLSPNINTKVKKILDYGGNVGDYAHTYGKQLKLKKKDIYVMDINDWAGEKWIPRKDITWIHSNDTHKIKHNSVDLIILQHVLHHINKKQFPDIISFFNNILTKTGTIVLYEHDSYDKNISNVIDLEHILYDIVMSKKISYSDYFKNNYAEYFSLKEWMKIFSKYFKVFKILEIHNIDNSFYLFFKKI